MNLNKALILPLLTSALKEDIGARDLTVSALIPKDQTAKAEIIVHREGVIAGLPVAEAVFSLLDPKIRFQPLIKEGEKVFADKVIAFMEGPARGILSAERTALNFLGHLSGIATAAALFTEKIKGTQAKILDTRKTTPGLRLLEKYAVAVGGGVNHRMGLFDGVLIKENHLRMVSHRTAGAFGHLSAVEESVRLARQQSLKNTVIEIEVTTLDEFRKALAASADIILLDNMRLNDIEEAVRLRNALFRSRKEKRILLEVSGGITISNVRAVALSGVDRISVGAITHSAPSLDMALEIVG